LDSLDRTLTLNALVRAIGMSQILGLLLAAYYLSWRCGIELTAFFHGTAYPQDSSFRHPYLHGITDTFLTPANIVTEYQISAMAIPRTILSGV
jgi:hypothetical protein